MTCRGVSALPKETRSPKKSGGEINFVCRTSMQNQIHSRELLPNS